MERRDHEAFATRAGVDEPGSDERPAELVGEAAAEPDDERLGTLARERAPAGQGRWIERRPRLVDDLEAVERRLRRGTQHFVGAGPAAELGCLLVREYEPETGVLDGDPGVDRLEDPTEPIVGRDGTRPNAGNRARWLDDSLAHVPSHNDAQPP